MSERIRSKPSGEYIAILDSRSGANRSSLTNITPSTFLIACRSTATLIPFLFTDEMYWLHPPGEAPKSRIFIPSFIRENFSSICSSLYIALLLKPSFFAFL